MRYQEVSNEMEHGKAGKSKSDNSTLNEQQDRIADTAY